MDAFTNRLLGGDPCAVVFDCADLDDNMMLAIAREMNLSETSFVWTMDDTCTAPNAVRRKCGRFRAHYFTPAEEIPLAWHPTIETLYSLIDSGRLRRDGSLSLALWANRESHLYCRAGTLDEQAR
jgi:trans-2,3-dihydro-3-hydroxyanthranilate isomerase